MFELIAAFLLDLLIGDPAYSWHPVRIVGGWVKKTEAWLRSKISDERIAGFLQAVLLPLGVYAFVWLLTEVAGQFHPQLKSLVGIYFLYSAISIKDLSLEAGRVYLALRDGKLDAARQNLSRIVGRDTENLDETEVVRGTVEAVAESFVDGVLSPLFYAALGGAPLAMAYKAVNTLDSMVGLRTRTYEVYGRTAARIDEWANWIPARLSWFLVGVGAFFVNGRAQEAWHVALRHLRHVRSNGVIPEAAFAGALGVELGGTNSYGGTRVDTPKLGYALRNLEPRDIRRATQVMKASSWTALVFAILLSALTSLIFA